MDAKSSCQIDQNRRELPCVVGSLRMSGCPRLKAREGRGHAPHDPRNATSPGIRRKQTLCPRERKQIAQTLDGCKLSFPVDVIIPCALVLRSSRHIWTLVDGGYDWTFGIGIGTEHYRFLGLSETSNALMGESLLASWNPSSAVISLDGRTLVMERKNDFARPPCRVVELRV